MLFRSDPAGAIVMVNPAFEAITGFGEADVLGHPAWRFWSADNDPELRREAWRTLEATGVWQGEVWHQRRGGDVFPQMLSITTMRGRTGRVANFVGVFSDISVLKASEARLTRLALHDPLTGLSNRTHFQRELEGDRKSTRLNSSHIPLSRMPSSA